MNWYGSFSLPHIAKEKNLLIFISNSVKKMINLFDDCVSSVSRCNIKVKTLQKYALKCDNITRGCDEIKMISKDDYLLNCPCFQKVVFNGTNSKDVSLDCDCFRDCIFDSISISLDVFQSCLLYKVVGVYDFKTYDLIDFRFYTEDSRKAKINGYKSDILIHGKAWRLQVVSGGKFNIRDFLYDLVCYDVPIKDRYISTLNDYYITRFDFRIDFFHQNDIKHLNYDDVYGGSARKQVDNLVIDRHSKKIYTGWTAGNRKDKYVYTRMYQKQVEALDKGHGELYIDYLDYPGKVRRLEFEFGSKFTTARKQVSFDDEYLNHFLTNQIFEYIGLSPKNGYFSKPKNKIDVPFDMYSSYKKQRLITQYKNITSKLYKGGLNPYIIVNYSLKDNCGFDDNKQLEDLFDESLYTIKDYNYIIETVSKCKYNTKDLYERIYNSQLGIDL